jgi:hypothetical protein
MAPVALLLSDSLGNFARPTTSTISTTGSADWRYSSTPEGATATALLLCSTMRSAARHVGDSLRVGDRLLRPRFTSALVALRSLGAGDRHDPAVARLSRSYSAAIGGLSDRRR